jgi:hypothetical protein
MVWQEIALRLVEEFENEDVEARVEAPQIDAEKKYWTAEQLRGGKKGLRRRFLPRPSGIFL